MFLSIIVPVYNTEAYLSECIHSMLEQDLPKTEYEIICINDGSSDGSLACLQSFSADGIVIIDQANAGVCAARNRGLAEAKGDYVWFVDSDDFIAENCISALKRIAEEKKPDRLIIDHYSFSDQAFSPTKRDCLPENLACNTSWYDSVPWRSIIKRDFMIQHGVSFQYPELSFGEDALFLFELTYHSPVTEMTNLPCYYHRIRSGSLSSDEKGEIYSANLLRKIESNVREAAIVKTYYDKEDPHRSSTANRMMIFLWGALYATSALPWQDAKTILEELRAKGLFPYTRPAQCQIRKSYVLNRGDYLEKVFDYIYINLHTRWGFFIMRLWNELVRVKSRVSKMKNRLETARRKRF